MWSACRRFMRREDWREKQVSEGVGSVLPSERADGGHVANRQGAWGHLLTPWILVSATGSSHGGDHVSGSNAQRPKAKVKRPPGACSENSSAPRGRRTAVTRTAHSGS